jgi:hypothetical protein
MASQKMPKFDLWGGSQLQIGHMRVNIFKSQKSPTVFYTLNLRLTSPQTLSSEVIRKIIGQLNLALMRQNKETKRI